MRETIREILELAVNAPSGHNSQPWRFVVKEDSLQIFNIPDKDKTIFNWKQRGSLTAHGALIENIAIISSDKDYDVNITLFPEGQESNLIAEINFIKNNSNYTFKHLSPFIPKRATNRKPYKITSLTEKDRKTLNGFIKSLENTGYQIFLKESRGDIKQLSTPFSMGDRLLFENRYLHKALFDNVNWTLKEEEEKREGLYVKTKELSLPARLFFKYAMSNWNILQKLNKIKFSEKAAKKRENLYKECSAIGLIVTSSDSPKDFVEAGRILERFWLTATSLGLSFQPVSIGLLYLGQRCQREEVEELTPTQKEFVREAYKKITEVFNIGNKIPTFSFRIGYAEPPTASSLKKKPEIKYLN